MEGIGEVVTSGNTIVMSIQVRENNCGLWLQLLLLHVTIYIALYRYFSLVT